MNMKWLTLVLLPACTLKADAQDARGGFIAFGWHHADVDELNSRLVANGYPEFSGHFVNFGGGFNWWKRQVMFSVELNGLLQPGETSALHETSLTGGYIVGSVGLPIKPASNIYVYPMISAGAGGAQLDIETRASVSFEELLDNPGRTASVSNAAFMFGPQLGAHVFLPIGKIAGRGMIVGVRAGYLLAAFESDWSEIDGESVNGGPAMDFSGPHITIVIGGWGLKPRDAARQR
jgi:hypothetical protein